MADNFDILAEHYFQPLGILQAGWFYKRLTNPICPASLIGFCVDVANSLRNFEDTNTVLDLLSPRAVCYHLNDYVVAGSNVGFAVSGAPLGEGWIGAPGLLRRIRGISNSMPQTFIETWTPGTGLWPVDVDEDAQRLAAYIHNLRMLLADLEAEIQPRVDVR